MTESSDVPQVLRRVARGGSANLAATVASALLGLALTLVVARGFDTTSAGEFFAATSMFLILVAVAAFGTDSSLPRFIPALRLRGREDQIRPVVLFSTWITLAVTGLLALAMVPFSGEATALLGEGEHGSSGALVWMVLAAVPFAAIANNHLAATQGFNKILPTIWVDRLGRPILQLAGVAAAALTAAAVGWAIGSWLLAMAIAVLPSAWMLWRIGGWDRHSSEHIAADIRSEYVKYSWPRAVARMLAVLLQRLDVVLVAALISPSDAAIYAVATRLIVLGQLTGNSLQQVIAPRIAHFMESAQPSEAMWLSRVSAGWVMLTAWPICLLSITCGNVFLRIMGGEDYEAGAPALAILGCALLVGTMVGPVDTVILMSGRSVVSLLNMAIAVILDVGLMLWWIPPFGISGAAAAWATAIVVRSLLGVVFVRRFTGQAVLGRPALAAAAASSIAFAAVPLALQLGTRSLPVALAGMVLSCAVYVPLLWLLRRPLALEAITGMLRNRRG